MMNHYLMKSRAKVESVTQKDLSRKKSRKQAKIKLMIQGSQQRNARLRNQKSGTTRELS